MVQHQVPRTRRWEDTPPLETLLERCAFRHVIEPDVPMLVVRSPR